MSALFSNDPAGNVMLAVSGLAVPKEASSEAAARDRVELMQRDRAPFESSQGTAFVLALRPWTYSGFAEFNRG